MYVVRDKEGEGESTKIRGNGKSLTKQTSEPRGGKTKARIIAFFVSLLWIPKRKATSGTTLRGSGLVPFQHTEEHLCLLLCCQDGSAW